LLALLMASHVIAGGVGSGLVDQTGIEPVTS
jgi:hypothetical protein